MKVSPGGGFALQWKWYKTSKYRCGYLASHYFQNPPDAVLVRNAQRAVRSPLPGPGHQGDGRLGHVQRAVLVRPRGRDHGRRRL